LSQRIVGHAMPLRPSTSIAFALLIGVLVIATQVATQHANKDLLTETVRQREIDKINTVSGVLRNMLKQRELETQTIAKLLASDSDLAVLIDRSEPARSQAFSSQLAPVHRIGRDQVLEVTDANETVIYRAQDPERKGDQATGWGVAEALNGTGSMASVRGLEGVTVRAIEPLRMGSRIVGTVSAGFSLDEAFFKELSQDVGAQLRLLSRKGSSKVPTKTEDASFDSMAMEEAFEGKVPIYRFNENTHVTSVYLPVLIVDEAYVLLAQLDSASAYRLIEDGREKAYSNAVAILVVSLLAGLLALHYLLAPLQRLRRKAEALAVELTGAPIKQTSRDEVTSVVRVLETLTERLVVRNKELDHAKVQAEAASVAKSQFLSSMSHEIRTPLNGVLGMAELLQGTPLNDEQTRLVGTISSAGRALHGLLSDILDLAKIEEGQVTIERIDFDPQRLITDVASVYREIATSRKLTLVTDASGLHTAWASGDPTRLRQVITNLLGNALKFTSSGEVRLLAQSIAPPAGDPRHWMRISVEDTGIGMSSEALGKMFKRFEQADISTTRKFGGSGLGLAICKHLVDLMGGSIDVSSTEGRGSCFWFDVPMQEPIAPPLQPGNPTPATDENYIARANILVAEDNNINQLVIRKLLERLGGTATIVDNGERAVQAVQSTRYDIVFMDCQMPVLDGYEATRAIRRWEQQHPDKKPLPIVALTANALASDREACLKAGMTDFVTKPVNGGVLKQVLERYLKPA